MLKVDADLLPTVLNQLNQSTKLRQVEKFNLYLFTDCTEVLSDKVVFTTQLELQNP